MDEERTQNAPRHASSGPRCRGKSVRASGETGGCVQASLCRTAYCMKQQSLPQARFAKARACTLPSIRGTQRLACCWPHPQRPRTGGCPPSGEHESPRVAGAPKGRSTVSRTTASMAPCPLTDAQHENRPANRGLADRPSQLGPCRTGQGIALGGSGTGRRGDHPQREQPSRRPTSARQRGRARCSRPRCDLGRLAATLTVFRNSQGRNRHAGQEVMGRGGRAT